MYVSGQHPQACILSVLQPVVGVVWALFCITRLAVYSIRLVVAVPSFSSAHGMHITLWPVMGVVWALFCITHLAVYSIRLVVTVRSLFVQHTACI